MLKVEDMSHAEMHELLERQSFGHLGCARDGRPYVVPMNYAFDGENLYFFTTEGMKTNFIESNPEVCLQVEEVADSSHWRSVMVIGRAGFCDVIVDGMMVGSVDAGDLTRRLPAMISQGGTR